MRIAVNGASFCIAQECGRLRQLRQTEIKQLDASTAGDENILRLQVAVNDSFVMRSRKSLRDLNRIFSRLTHRKRPGAHALPQRLSFQQFADNIRSAAFWFRCRTQQECWDDSALRQPAPPAGNDAGVPASEENEAGKTLMATSRFSRESRARYTSPMPPAPMAAEISYGPNFVPGFSAIDDGLYRHNQSVSGN